MVFDIGVLVQKRKTWRFLNKIACFGGIFMHSPHSLEVGALPYNHILVVESIHVRGEASAVV